MVLEGSQERKKVLQLGLCCQGRSCEKAHNLVKSAGNKAVLRSFSSDCTPLKTILAARFKVGMSQVYRFGYMCAGYFVRVCFYRCHTEFGEAEDAVIVGNLVPLTHGKSVDAQFAAGLTLAESLREMGHVGIAIEHTSFDSCGYAKLSLRHKQQHLELEKDYKPQGTTGVSEQCLTR